MHVLANTNFSDRILQRNRWLLTKVVKYKRDNCLVGASEVLTVFI